jgi:uncharacterized membrane protein YdbT with pleckstrin-like domain
MRVNAAANVVRVSSVGVAEIEMSYVRKSLVPGETLMYDTRHHWIVLLGPLLMSLVLAALGIGCLGEVVAAREGRGFLVDAQPNEMHAAEIAGIVLLVIAGVALIWGLTKRSATEMAVTNKRVLIKTGLGNRRTLDLMLSRVESIGVDETFWGRMLGYGSVTLRGTGGTPESFVMISHPQQFRRSVQAQIGHVEPVSAASVPPRSQQI